MKCENNFNKFNKNISLGATRMERINNGVANLKKFTCSDKNLPEGEGTGIADILMEIFIQGSYAIGTCIKPAKSDDEFDVDVVLLLSIDPTKVSSPEVLKWLQERLNSNKDYKGKIVPKKRCIRIDYAGDFHLDVVPIVSGEGAFLIPDKNEGWSDTDPKGVIAWCNQREIISGKRFKRIVKHLKWWRSAVAPNKADVSSILLTTLIGNNIVLKSSDAEGLVAVMNNISGYLKGEIEVPFIAHPVFSSQNLAQDLTKEKYSIFKDAFIETTQLAINAYNEADEGKSVELWRGIFGNEFPADISSAGSSLLGLGGATFPNRPVTPNKPGGFA